MQALGFFFAKYWGAAGVLFVAGSLSLEALNCLRKKFDVLGSFGELSEAFAGSWRLLWYRML